MTRLVLPAVVFASVAVAQGASISHRDDFIDASASVFVRPVGGGTEFGRAVAFSDNDGGDNVATPSQAFNVSGSGRVGATADASEDVLTGSGSASVTSTLSNVANNVSYSVTGSYASTITTGNLDNFVPQAPDGTPANTTDFERVGSSNPGYNSGISLQTSVPLNFTITLSQTLASGTVFNAALIYRDDNGDRNQDPGELEILPYNVISGNDTRTITGTLPASASEYRIFFFGNVFNETTESFTTLDSSANYSSTFVTAGVPEPTTLATLGVAAMGVLARRRR